MKNRARVSSLTAVLLVALCPGIALGDGGVGQTTGVITTQFSGPIQVSNPQSGQALIFSNGAWSNAASPAPTSAGFDSLFGSTQGSVIYRNATTWVALAPGTSGQVLQSGGAGANPAWATVSLTLGSAVNAGNVVNSVAASGRITWTTGGTYSQAVPQIGGPTDQALNIAALSQNTLALYGGSASGANQQSGRVDIVEGAGTGNQLGQGILFYVSPINASGSSAQSQTNTMNLVGAQNNLSGSTGVLTINPTWADGGTNSTTVARTLYVKPTINYTAGTKTGHYEAISVGVTETSLPTGTNYLLALRAGAAGTTDKVLIRNTGATYQAAGAFLTDATAGGGFQDGFGFYNAAYTAGTRVNTGGLVCGTDLFVVTGANYITSGVVSGDTSGNGGYGFLSTGGVLDTRISRGGAGAIYVGTGAAGAENGFIRAQGFGSAITTTSGINIGYATAAKLQGGSLTTFGWTAGADNAALDTGLSRDSAGIVAFGTGAQGSLAGSWKATNGTLTGALNCTSGTITASNPGINLTQTFNSGGVTFHAATFNITATACANGSTAMRWQQNGTTYMDVRMDTAAYGVLNFYSGGANTHIIGNSTTLGISGGTGIALTATSGNVTVNAVSLSPFSDAAFDLGTSSLGWRDLYMSRTVAKYNNITTEGWGVPAINKTGRATAQTAANANVLTYAMTADGSLLVSANVLVTTSSAENFTVTCAYTDEGGTGRTQTLPFDGLAGTSLTSILAANGAVPYAGSVIRIRAKSGTNVVVATTGTFTGCTYNVEADLVRVK